MSRLSIVFGFCFFVVASFAPVGSSWAQNEDEEVIEFEDDESMLNEDKVEAELSEEDDEKVEDKPEAAAVAEEPPPPPAPEDVPANAEAVKAEAAPEQVTTTELVPKEESVEAPVEAAPPAEVLAAPESAPEPEPSVETESVAAAVADSEPDLEYEAQLYDIYLRHLSKSTSQDEWGRVVGTRTDQNYVIQKGDTLWDISRTLFGDGNYWPKIWSLNSSITNPHLIRPKNIIRFILGDETGPPAFTVAEGDQQDSSPTPVSPVAQDDGPELPPPSKKYNPVVKKLPPSLPAYQDPSAQSSAYDDAGIEYGKRKISELKDEIPLAAYISEESPKALGVISEVELGYNLASSLQYVYVRMNKGEGDIGATYLSVMNRGPIKADRDLVKQSSLGFGIEVLGEVQLLEKVSSEKKNQDQGDVYRALVTKTVSPVAVDSILIPGQIEAVDLRESGSKSQIVAQIVGGQFTNDRQLYGPQSFAFLNKGQNDGLQEGQILPIRLNRKARDKASQVLANVRAIGWLKIVKTTPRFATAVILRSWEGVVTGDFTGAGEMSNLTEAAPSLTEDPSVSTNSTLEEEFGDEESE